MSKHRSWLHWSVPVGMVVAIAGVAAVPHLTPAGAAPVPNLPELTPSELLVKVRSADVQAFSGDVTLAANLGLPDLGSLGTFGDVGGGSVISYLSGRHTAQVWANGPDQVRVAVAGKGAESDWIRDGSDVWAWDSRTQTVTHASLPPTDPAQATPEPPGPPSAVTPQQMADELLASVDPSTAVSVETPGYIAGRPVYELVLAPRTDASTIGRVSIAVDAATGAPLDLQITARGAGSPALRVGFTKVSFDVPAVDTFAFTPPPGASVVEAANPGEVLGLGTGPIGGPGRRVGSRGGARPKVAPDPGSGTPDSTGPDTPGPATVTVGSDWSTVAIVSGVSTGGRLDPILRDAQTVDTPAGTARLVTTPLVNVLVLPDGRIALGAVTVATLQAAVGG